MLQTTGVLALVLCSLLSVAPALGMNRDGELLLGFKRSIVSDPLAALADWNSDDATPCFWNGVACMGFPAVDNATASVASRVISLILPDSHLSGRVPPELGLLEHLRHLDLSGNAIYGTLPASILNVSELRILSLASNEISGDFPDVGRLSNLQVLNLSGNALEGAIPATLALLPRLTVVSVANNHLCGELTKGGFGKVEYLDMSSNLVNGTIPPDFDGRWLRYLNLSHNQLTGEIPPAFASEIPVNATVDLAFNHLTGAVPQVGAFASQKPQAFAGNPELCGKPLENLCTIPSTLYKPPDPTTEAPLASKSPPAFAVLPKNAEGDSPASVRKSQGRLRPAVVIAIAVGDLAGVGFLLAVFFYVYQTKKKKSGEHREEISQEHQPAEAAATECHVFGGLPCCLTKKGDEDHSDETSGESTSVETEAKERLHKGRERDDGDGGGGGTPPLPRQLKPQRATLVTVDGEPQLELETLLKASAFVIGATGSSIVYKAVLTDGTALAVRRIGEGGAVDRLKDFEAQVRGVAKFRHPNLLRLRGFYWGADEKLLIHDFASNGSLANVSFTKKLGSSALHLNWESRLRVARGLAKGLAYLHEKKATHGNIKPSNVLLDAEMEPKIADFGLERLISGDGVPRLSASARLFGTKRPAQSPSNPTELPSPALSGVTEVSPRASTSGTAAAAGLAAAARYQAPEKLKNLKPNAKWDVYSFGALLLELVAGRALSEAEIGQGAAGFVVEERNRILRMTDPAVRGEVEGREEALLRCFRLGFDCCSIAPHRRPSIKDAVLVLEKAALCSAAASTAFAIAES
ncbi:hypothetical protein ZIOFF_027631 [Zingiber officinale]|uniref:Protein kinase domain-containing protein n=2 Tax=Zingiber officinale TaxID=94328 RepID=A0A8J5GTJ3_ZINOF|nr:hypothetical protein ZIOFF_027631 [Zingiber officinale]